MRKIFGLLLAVSAIVLGALWFAHWSKLRTLNSGEVHVRQQPQRSSTPTPTPTQEVASNAAETSSGLLSNQAQNNIAALPAIQPLSREPSNGIVAAGSGKFQLYRQGDLTFRLNTESGQACVLFATISQWRKPLVYDHGCANH